MAYAYNNVFLVNDILLSKASLPHLPPGTWVCMKFKYDRYMYQHAYTPKNALVVRNVTHDYCARKIQTAWRKLVQRRHAARVIQRYMEPWLDSIHTRDGKPGIRYRIARAAWARDLQHFF
jgi:hypothetical protein